MGRERWKSRTVFLFAAIGSAVGLGNVWRFPYMTYKFGGGAFLIPYLIALFVIGLPLLMLEFALGQRFQRGAVASFKKIHHKLGGVGLLAILSGFVIVLYYAVIMAWTLIFMLNSFSANLPWADNAEGYFYNSVLGLTDSVSNIGGIDAQLLIALFIIWLIIYLIVRKGVESVGKVVLISMPLPIILLLVLFIRGMFLPGAFSGISAYLTPNFGALLDPAIWVAAISQIFFTLSIGFGIMTAYASFNKKTQDVKGDSYITALSNSAISLFAGFVVFAILGYMSVSSGVDISEVATSGPGLAFVVFPQALSLMPFAWFFSLLFFLALFSLGIDSAFSIVEAVNTTIGDKYKKPNRQKIAFYTCLISFLLGIIFVTGAGLYFLDIVDYFINNYGLVTAGLLEAIVIGWYLGPKKLRMFVKKQSGCDLGSWWDYAIKYVIPLVLIVLLGYQLFTDITTPYGGYPWWALMIGWLSFLIPLVIAIVYSLRGKRDDIILIKKRP